MLLPARQPRNHAAPCPTAKRQSVSAEISILSDQWMHQPHSPTSTERNNSSSPRSGAKTAYSARNSPTSTMLSAPPRQLTARERLSLGRTALMFGGSLTLKLSIQPGPLVSENLDIISCPRHRVRSPRHLPGADSHCVYLHNRAKAASLDVKMRRHVVVSIDCDLAGREAANSWQASPLKRQ